MSMVPDQELFDIKMVCRKLQLYDNIKKGGEKMENQLMQEEASEKMSGTTLLVILGTFVLVMFWAICGLI